MVCFERAFQQRGVLVPELLACNMSGLDAFLGHGER